ncbi:RdgB/HAM1 family non-canonical purine NTP pyrophosphatase [Microscilla marina]|uniref:dITP/XTP pyrophosphatase n=1 Tax=Microscilla marina ATCC 23134 TaxID=313606 RepID=A1ZPM1_MICM2|nr:RdgB/HAM1 family non-canonical purine NTP pyrophosphatase [Microscilla marina]EAY27760.1 non-canonical purine NTP pyrophosphatase, RdgB/HAM1 family [Microscilla marina ATCC 23134]
MKLCFATRNTNKIKEVKAKLGATFEVISLDDIQCNDELPETTGTIEGNSAQKAQYVWDHFQVNCFADDTGLEVEALEGAPGVDSAMYAGKHGDSKANITLLLKNLQGNAHRKAQFKTVITLVVNGIQHQFEGIAAGTILPDTRGSEGFGYDPIFLPEGHTQTFAEMSLEQKNDISHRSKAFVKLVDFLQNKI